jgi:hypothetical protein
VPGRSYSPTFGNPRAESAGYTTSSPGWRRDQLAQLLAAAAAAGGGAGGPPATTGAGPAAAAAPAAPAAGGGGGGPAQPPPIPPELLNPGLGVLEDRATRFRPPDVGGTPTLPYEPKNAPIGSIAGPLNAPIGSIAGPQNAPISSIAGPQNAPIGSIAGPQNGPLPVPPPPPPPPSPPLAQAAGTPTRPYEPRRGPTKKGKKKSGQYSLREGDYGPLGKGRVHYPKD